MADNYLEKRLEDYRNGKLQSSPKGKSGIKSGSTLVARAYIVGGCCEQGRNMVQKLRNYGWQVAFCDTNEKDGRKLAQTMGAQFHPMDELTADAISDSLRMVVERWGGVDFIVLTKPNQAELFSSDEMRYGATLSLLL